MTITSNPKNLELNVGDQILFGLDVSASMQTTDCPGSLSRIEYAKEQAKVFASEAGKYDEDGADYFTFGSKVTPYYSQTVEQAHKLIADITAKEASTDTAGVIQSMWKRAQELRSNGVTDNIVAMIITDGEPRDREAVKKTIRDIAETLDNGEDFGIIFLTIGNIEPGLESFLTELDDTLNAKHDIVDVKNFLDVNFEEAFAGAVHD